MILYPVRLFYAVIFDRETRADLTGLQARIRPMIQRGNWTREENLHLTLHYVGETDPSELPRFKAALEQASEGIPPFALDFTGFGAFRQRKHHLIYVRAYSSGKAAFGRAVPLLAERLKEILQAADMKPVKPHVTLVRKAEIGPEALKRLKLEETGLAPAPVNSLHLMESRTVKGVLNYISLHETSL